MLPSGSRDSLHLLGENPYLSSQKINSRDSFSIAKFISFLVNIQFAIVMSFYCLGSKSGC